MSTTTNSTVGGLQLTIGSSIFTASLLNNPTTDAFQSLLPLNIQMSELNGNEKSFDLPTTLPTAASDPGQIRVGDLMLWGSRTLVLWYEDYESGYTYTRIGAIDNPEGLVAAVGSGDVDVGITARSGSGGSGSGGSGSGSVTSPTTANPPMSPSTSQTSMASTKSQGWKVLSLVSLLSAAYIVSC